MSPVIARLAQLLAVTLPNPADGVVERIPTRFEVVGDVLGKHPQLHLRIKAVVLLADHALFLVLQRDKRCPRCVFRQLSGD